MVLPFGSGTNRPTNQQGCKRGREVLALGERGRGRGGFEQDDLISTRLQRLGKWDGGNGRRGSAWVGLCIYRGIAGGALTATDDTGAYR
uniref:Uncharacterized protein n=1 Tax=Setaria viridis TaxID=4556 RepID=A0A4U6T2D9_SETVI|nr:hypothetical protein SEVIR_9G323150v2 [Setaria viridis]